MTLGTLLRTFGILILVCTLMLYVLFQGRNFIQGPILILNDTGNTAHSERTVLLSGTARNIVKLTVNGLEIHTNESGDFTHRLILEDGYSVTTLYAEDRFGRSTHITKQFVYTP